MKKFTTAQIVALAVLGLFWVYCAYQLAAEDKQWDFKTYYYAAEAQQRNLDAYNVDITSQLAGTRLTLSYVYPPLTLWFFRLFQLVEYPVASLIFLILKFVLLAALLFMWMKSFLEKGDSVLFLWFVTFAFSSTVYWDLVAGNVALFEQALFWGALLALLRRKLLYFTLAIVLISFFKLTFIVFLALPFLLKEKAAYKYALGGLGAFLIYLYANYYFEARDFGVFWNFALALDERGELYNHALLPLLRDLFDRAASVNLIPLLPRLVPILVYLAAVAAAVIVTWRVYRKRTCGNSDQKSALETVFLACIVYALLMPRMKSYSFILMIPPAFYVLKKYVKAEAFIYLIILLSLTKWTPLPMPDLVRFLWWYYPWLCTLLIWILFLRHQREPAGDRL